LLVFLTFSFAFWLLETVLQTTSKQLGTVTLVEGMEGLDKDKGEMLASVQGNDSTEVTVTKRSRTGNESVDEFV
jgi:hypothetical protein